MGEPRKAPGFRAGLKSKCDNGALIFQRKRPIKYVAEKKEHTMSMFEKKQSFSRLSRIMKIAWRNLRHSFVVLMPSYAKRYI
jgi:hypothetical protein